MKKIIALVLSFFVILNSSVFANEEAYITRGEFASDLMDNFEYISQTFLFLLDGDNMFKDISGNKYAPKIILASCDFMHGYETREFRPNNNINRQEVAAVLYRLICRIDKKYNIQTDSAGDIDIIDNDYISDWASIPVKWVVYNNIMNLENNKFKPKKLITKKELSEIWERIKLRYTNVMPKVHIDRATYIEQKVYRNAKSEENVDIKKSDLSLSDFKFLRFEMDMKDVIRCVGEPLYYNDKLWPTYILADGSKLSLNDRMLGILNKVILETDDGTIIDINFGSDGSIELPE